MGRYNSGDQALPPPPATAVDGGTREVAGVGPRSHSTHCAAANRHGSDPTSSIAGPTLLSWAQHLEAMRGHSSLRREPAVLLMYRGVEGYKEAEIALGSLQPPYAALLSKARRIWPAYATDWLQ